MAQIIPQGNVQPVAVPVAVAVPANIPVVAAFATIAPVTVPVAFGAHMSPQVWGILAAAESFTIRQHVKLLPKKCCSCPPCVKQENTYSIYAGLSENPANELFRADEVSEDWNRCCCSPNHPLKVEVRQYLPTAQDLNGSNPDWVDLTADWNRFTGKDRINAEKAAYEQVPVGLTMVRDGTQFPMCCNKCVGCFICTSCCADGFTLVAGPTAEESKKQIGKGVIDNLDPSMTIGKGEVPAPFGGCCTPTLNLSRGAEADSFAKIEGPTCFGGLSECCCSFTFPVSKASSAKKAGDLAQIIKQKPKSVWQAVKEGMTDADMFTVEFRDKTLSPEEKSLILAGVMLNDYTYFEQGPGDKCGTDAEGKMYINFCNWYCCGMLYPMRVTFGGGDA